MRCPRWIAGSLSLSFLLLPIAASPAPAQEAVLAAPLRAQVAANAVDTMHCDTPLQGTHCIRFSCTGSCQQSIPDLDSRVVSFGVTEESLAALGVENCTIEDLNFALELDHADVGDLHVSLAKAGALTRSLYNPSSLCDATAFDGLLDDGSTVAANTCPFSGSSMRSDDSLSPFAGLDPVGNWNLTIEDLVQPNAGMLRDYGFALDVTCDAVETGACAETPTMLCLNNDRFRVQATFQVPGGAPTQTQVVKLTSDTGYLWHLNPNNVESVIKVLNGCAVNGRYWVFAGGLTNVRVEITVTDTQTGATKTYTNPQGAPFQPIQDTNAFSTCP